MRFDRVSRHFDTVDAKGLRVIEDIYKLAGKVKVGIPFNRIGLRVGRSSPDELLNVWAGQSLH